MKAGTDHLEVAGGSDHPASLSIPLQVRGEIIGSLDVWQRSGSGDEAGGNGQAEQAGAAVQEEQVYLLTTLASRISQVLESARLFEEAQRLAAREQAVNTITAKIRGVPTVNTILQRTVEELGRAFGASRATLSVQVSEPVNKA